MAGPQSYHYSWANSTINDWANSTINYHASSSYVKFKPNQYNQNLIYQGSYSQAREETLFEWLDRRVNEICSAGAIA